MKTLADLIAEKLDRARRTRAKQKPVAIDVHGGDVQLIRSLGLDAASVAFPAGITLEERAARMNAFWDALVDLQYRDVLVIALCATKR